MVPRPPAGRAKMCFLAPSAPSLACCSAWCVHTARRRTSLQRTSPWPAPAPAPAPAAASQSGRTTTLAQRLQAAARTLRLQRAMAPPQLLWQRPWTSRMQLWLRGWACARFDLRWTVMALTLQGRAAVVPLAKGRTAMLLLLLLAGMMRLGRLRWHHRLALALLLARPHRAPPTLTQPRLQQARPLRALAQSRRSRA